MKKKKSDRARAKNPALQKKYTLKTRQDLVEIDYLDKLSDKEKQWLNKFNDEYINANVSLDNRRNQLHRTKKLTKDCTDRNNARNRCIFTRNKASGDLLELGNIQNTANEIELNVMDARELVEEFEETKSTKNRSNSRQPAKKNTKKSKKL